ncbi:hypothetical protein ACFY2J_34175 [Streptomyces collinus]|uniref:hypothetical protein n=1 Tax=Streptomyces collinus TaxID=42684 RepID=UPI00369FF939
MHDRIAELAGLRDELTICKNGPRESRRDKAGEVQEQIGRVRGELEDEAKALESRAKELLEGGQDGAAGELQERARAVREALDADTDRGEGKRGKRTAAAPKPPQTR